MLSLLASKRSLSAGILDGGGSEISLGGSRLNCFMKEVERVTGKMGEAEAVSSDEEIAGAAAAPPAAGAPDGDGPPTALSEERGAAAAVVPVNGASARQEAAADL